MITHYKNAREKFIEELRDLSDTYEKYPYAEEYEDYYTSSTLKSMKDRVNVLSSQYQNISRFQVLKETYDIIGIDKQDSELADIMKIYENIYKEREKRYNIEFERLYGIYQGFQKRKRDKPIEINRIILLNMEYNWYFTDFPYILETIRKSVS